MRQQTNCNQMLLVYREGTIVEASHSHNVVCVDVLCCVFKFTKINSIVFNTFVFWLLFSPSKNIFTSNCCKKY